jgi:hypothetical protein
MLGLVDYRLHGVLIPPVDDIIQLLLIRKKLGFVLGSTVAYIFDYRTASCESMV